METEQESFRPAGGRKITAQRLKWDKIAQEADLENAPAQSALIQLAAAMPMAKIISLPYSALLRHLICSVHKDNLTKMPVVYKSNRCLGEELGLSAARISTMLSRLYDDGFITMADSPNCKRFRITDGGEIIAAFGIDLRVLIARFAEISAKIDDERRKMAEKRSALNAFRYAMRNFKAFALERGSSFIKLLERVRSLVPIANSAPLRLLRRLARYLNRLLREEILRSADFNTSNPYSRDTENNEHIHNTTLNPSRKSNQNGNESSPRTETEAPNRQSAGILQAEAPKVTKKLPELWHWKKYMPNMQSVFTTHAFDGYDPGIIEKIGRVCGISDHALAAARETMGLPAFILSCYLIFEKWMDGKVYKPGGYLRGMTAKAENGELHLEKSLFGLSAAQLGEKNGSPAVFQ